MFPPHVFGLGRAMTAVRAARFQHDAENGLWRDPVSGDICLADPALFAKPEPECKVLLPEPDPHLAAYRRVQAEVEQAKAEADRFRGTCEACRHFRSTTDGYDLQMRYGKRECANPLVSKHRFNPETGEIESLPHRMGHYSSTGGQPDLCGKSRELFAPKLSRWDRLRQWWRVQLELDYEIRAF